MAFFDPLKGLYLPCCSKVVCWGSHSLELFHNTDFKGHINCPLCGMPNLASQPSLSLLQEACLTNPSLTLSVTKATVSTTPRPPVGTRSRNSVDKNKDSVTYPPPFTSPHFHPLSDLLHNTHDMYTLQPIFVGIITFVPCGKNTHHPPSISHLSHTHARYTHTHPQESAKNLGPDTVPSTLTAVKKVGFRPRVEPPHSTTLAQCHPIPSWPFSCLHPLQLPFPTFTPCATTPSLERYITPSPHSGHRLPIHKTLNPPTPSCLLPTHTRKK